MPGARLTTVNMTDRMTTFNNVKPSREELEGAARWQEGPRTGKQWHCVWVEAAGEPPPSPPGNTRALTLGKAWGHVWCLTT